MILDMAKNPDKSSWDVKTVAWWLEDNHLGALVKPFRTNAIDGKDLQHLTEDDLVEHTGCTPLQAKKISRVFKEPAVGVPAAAPEKYASPGSKDEQIRELQRKLELQAMKEDLRKEFSEGRGAPVIINNDNSNDIDMAQTQEEVHYAYNQPSDDECTDKDCAAWMQLPFCLCWLPFVCD